MGIHAVGETRLVRSLDEVSQALASWQRVVCKSLWSCSGRGVFVIDGATTPSDTGRLRRLLREQGGVEVQKAYDRLLDFALEFSTDGSAVHYLGASAFQTNASGGYAGNIVAPQAHIEQQICAALHTDEASLRRIIQTVGTEARHLLAHRYSGPFGIDMMAVVHPQGPALMPCIELNLRRTMGHVALKCGKTYVKTRVPAAPTAKFVVFLHLIYGWFVYPSCPRQISASRIVKQHFKNYPSFCQFLKFIIHTMKHYSCSAFWQAHSRLLPSSAR